MRARPSIDLGRLSAAAQRPGIDPRVWITLALVKEVGFDAEQGIFVDVQLQPSGELETCFLGAAYAGAEFGMYAPVQVDDMVLVAVPSGDPNHGPVIISRMWDAGDKPHADMNGTGGAASDNMVLRLKSGAKLLIRTSGDGGEVDIQVEGGANLLLRAGNQVRMQDASQSFVRGEDYRTALGNFLTGTNVVMTAIGTFATAVGVAVPAVAAAAVTLNAAIVAFASITNTFGNAHTTYLSTKVKGQ